MRLLQENAALAQGAAEGQAPKAAVIAAMERHLAVTRPASGNEALRQLRAAFPEAPLADRVAAVDAIRRYAF